MKKLSLDDLKVESYASQVSEAELAEVKGGTAWVCFDAGIAIVTVAIAAYDAFNSGSGSSSGGSAEAPNGGTSIYGIEADSIKITAPDGSTRTFYDAEIDSLRLYIQ